MALHQIWCCTVILILKKQRLWKSDVSLLHVGREFNETGQMEEWWTQTSVDNFIDRTLCYIEQYSDFNLFGIYVRMYTPILNKQHTVHGVPMTDKE